jgi:prepilin-type N-terminal cleavage/methylation domain-containing protein
MKRTCLGKGFTIVETLVAMVIMGVAFVGISHVILGTTKSNVDVEVTNQAVMLARDIMASTTAKDFDAVDDVASTSFGGNFSDYTYQVNVDYVEAADLDTAVAGPTDYKRVIVAVTATGWSGTVSLYNLKVSL